MLLVDGGARIEEKDHLYRRQSQTSAHVVLDGLSSSCRGQGKEERTCPKDRLAHAPPPPAALSSHILDRHGEEACASAGITSNDSRWHRGRARSRTARPQGGCPNEFDSLCESAARSREPRVEYGQDAQQQRPAEPATSAGYGKALQSAHQTTLYSRLTATACGHGRWTQRGAKRGAPAGAKRLAVRLLPGIASPQSECSLLLPPTSGFDVSVGGSESFFK